jgi:hypothetical protein
MYHILGYDLCIPGLPEEYCHVFPRSGMKSGTPQIHSAVKCDGLKFDAARIFYSKTNFDHASTHYSHMIPLQTRLGTVNTHIVLLFNLWLPAQRVSSCQILNL